MLRLLFCNNAKTSTVLRIAIGQCIFYAVIVGLSVFGAFYFKDFKPPEESANDDEEFISMDRLYMIIGILNIVPFLLAVALYAGVVTKRYYYLRIYIFIKIFETIINTIVLLVICLLAAIKVQIVFALMICAAPIVVGIWLIESIVIVNVFYTSKSKKNVIKDDQNQVVRSV